MLRSDRGSSAGRANRATLTRRLTSCTLQCHFFRSSACASPQVIITKDGQEDRPLSAAFVELLQNSIGLSARERQKRALADLAPATNGMDEGASWTYLVWSVPGC